MLPRWVRIALAFATTLAAWLVVVPARAAAPLCDHHGATAVAPAPQLQAPTTSIDAGDAPDGCADFAAALRAVEHGRAPAPEIAPAMQQATLPPIVDALRAGHLSLRAIDDAQARGPTGVRARVDRPPRRG